MLCGFSRKKNISVCRESRLRGKRESFPDSHPKSTPLVVVRGEVWYRCLLSRYRWTADATDGIISSLWARASTLMCTGFLNHFYLSLRVNVDGRKEYIWAGLPKSGWGVARIEPRTRRWYRGQHHGSAGTFILKTVVLKLESLNFLRSLVLSIAFSAKYSV